MAEGGEMQATGAGAGVPNVSISYAAQDAAVANSAITAALERQEIKGWTASVAEAVSRASDGASRDR
jgi:hypothetical protein